MAIKEKFGALKANICCTKMDFYEQKAFIPLHQFIKV